MRLVFRSFAVAVLLVAAVCAAQIDKAGPDWTRAQIEDALHAAPASVTTGARIYGWKGTELVMVREGGGPYSCVGSGSWSLRLGKPALPYPDPLCADQNAWAYLQALWKEKDPLHPAKPLPRAPGLVWMLAGMDVVNGRVSYGTGNQSTVQAGSATGIITMTPHIMILPLAVDAATAGLPTTYDQEHATMWVMGAGTPTSHLHVHFSPSTLTALRALP